MKRSIAISGALHLLVIGLLLVIWSPSSGPIARLLTAERALIRVGLLPGPPGGGPGEKSAAPEPLPARPPSASAPPRAGTPASRAPAKPTPSQVAQAETEGSTIVVPGPESNGIDPAGVPGGVSAETEAPGAGGSGPRGGSGTGEGTGGGRGRGQGIGRGDSADSLLALIRDRLEQAIRYPGAARRRGIEGTVVVSFRMTGLGDPEDLQVRQSSGVEILDEAAIETVHRASPLPYLAGRIEVPITFRLVRR